MSFSRLAVASIFRSSTRFEAITAVRLGCDAECLLDGYRLPEETALSVFRVEGDLFYYALNVEATDCFETLAIAPTRLHGFTSEKIVAGICSVRCGSAVTQNLRLHLATNPRALSFTSCLI
jgi:hypothetical protein